MFVLYPHDTQFVQGKSQPAPTGPIATDVDPDIAAHLEKLKTLADEDQELFLMKTRKTMDSIVNDLLRNTAQDVSSSTLFEKLNYLEDHNLLPKTTATFFHAIRKLGNLGAHESKGIHLTNSEIDTILSMLSYVLQWHKN